MTSHQLHPVSIETRQCLEFLATTVARSYSPSCLERTVDGLEIRRLPVEAGTFSHYLQGSIHPRWLFGISSINSIVIVLFCLYCMFNFQEDIPSLLIQCNLYIYIHILNIYIYIHILNIYIPRASNEQSFLLNGLFVYVFSNSSVSFIKRALYGFIFESEHFPWKGLEHSKLELCWLRMSEYFGFRNLELLPETFLSPQVPC